MNKLKELFEYQKYERDPKMEKMINEVEKEYLKKLSLDDLERVNAAGIGTVTVENGPAPFTQSGGWNNEGPIKTFTEPKSLPTKKGV